MSTFFICSEFRVHSCQWFYAHLQKRLNNFGSTKIIKSVGYSGELLYSSNVACNQFFIIDEIMHKNKHIYTNKENVFRPTTNEQNM